MEIVIPDPCLVVLVGAAGSGKSTFAARHFAADEILSSDRYRAMVSGDEADQSASRSAFARLHRDLETRLRAGRLTVVDATNVEPSARRALLGRARAAGLPGVAVVLDLPPATVIARNAARRSRTVDEAVVRRHLDALRRALDRPGAPLSGEGFESVAILRDPAAVDQTRVLRRPGTVDHHRAERQP